MKKSKLFYVNSPFSRRRSITPHSCSVVSAEWLPSKEDPVERSVMLQGRNLTKSASAR